MMPAASTPPPAREFQMPGLFRERPVGSWLAIAVLIVALAACWAMFFAFVATKYQGLIAPNIEADSSTYYQIAGVMSSDVYTPGQPLVTFAGNLLGPVMIAKVLRGPFFVAIFDFFLLLWLIHMAAQIPGVRRRYFVVLFFLNAESYVALVSLNKEILAAMGLVAFVVAIMRPDKRKRYLLLAAVFSIMARWEQLAILMMYLVLESRHSPFRGRHKTALFATLCVLTVMYTIVIRYSGLDLSGFLAATHSEGTVARLDAIQARFGLPLVILPKILMNLFNRWLTPQYFFSPAYYADSDFMELQSSVIIHLHSLAMLLLFAGAAIKRRLSFSRPIPYLIYLYLLVTCVSPFVQPRYEYPVYVLLCLQLAISPEIYEQGSERETSRQALPALAAG